MFFFYFCLLCLRSLPTKSSCPPPSHSPPLRQQSFSFLNPPYFSLHSNLYSYPFHAPLLFIWSPYSYTHLHLQLFFFMAREPLFFLYHVFLPYLLCYRRCAVSSPIFTAPSYTSVWLLSLPLSNRISSSPLLCVCSIDFLTHTFASSPCLFPLPPFLSAISFFLSLYPLRPRSLSSPSRLILLFLSPLFPSPSTSCLTYTSSSDLLPPCLIPLPVPGLHVFPLATCSPTQPLNSILCISTAISASRLPCAPLKPRHSTFIPIPTASLSPHAYIPHRSFPLSQSSSVPTSVASPVVSLASSPYPRYLPTWFSVFLVACVATREGKRSYNK